MPVMPGARSQGEVDSSSKSARTRVGATMEASNSKRGVRLEREFRQFAAHLQRNQPAAGRFVQPRRGPGQYVLSLHSERPALPSQRGPVQFEARLADALAFGVGQA